MIELFQDMGGRVLPTSKSGKCRGTFTSVLASALLEWLLILMLIIYAIFGYLITRFARYCELPVPCLLCSRIDNILGGEKAGFYWDMICGNHKLELSSLVYCHFHEKLVDVRGMCETCLFSFATKDKSNAETYRLLVGKLGEEDLSGFDDETFLDDRLTNKLKHCCCCNELWNPRRQTLLQAKSSGVDGPLSREASQDFDISEKDAVKTRASSTVIHVREMAEDPSVHFGYTDLKITSDSESDIQDHLENDDKKTHASSTIVHVREKTEDPLVDFGFTELKITSDNESDIHTLDNHDSLDNVGIKIQTSSTIIRVIEKMEDPLVDLGFTELKITSDSESDIHDTLEEEKKTQAPSTIIHVRENTEDHFGFTDLKITSDCESDIQVSDVHDSLEDEKRTQTSSKIVHVREKTEDLFGYTDLKITSDNESDLQVSYIHDSLVESKNTQKSSTIIHVREKTEDHLGYTDLKMTSDDESDILECDVEDARELISDDPFRNILLESTQVGPFISMSEDAMSPEHSQMSCELAASDNIQAPDSPSIVSPPAIGHGLEELNWQTIDHKPKVLASTELINVNDDRYDPLVSMETIHGELLSNTQNGGSVPLDFSKGDLETNGATFQTKVLVTDRNQELETLQTAKNLNSSDTRSEHTDGDVQMTNYLELGDAYKLAVSSRERQSSEKLTEQLTCKNSSNTNLDLKILLSQFSRGLNLPTTGILSPRVSRNLDDLKTIKLLQKRASLERNDSRSSLDRNESGIESLDFCSVVEIEGETELDRLKRQLEHDKRFLIALLKELEEERNASASATNEAMAMITRLQEEKAALQMEASQELRMMEEQAEYDIDALDKLNELVTEKEKEIQNLEEELDYYRCKYSNDVGDPLSDASRDEKEKGPPNDSWVITQDEREYLSECLKKLEKKLFHLGTHVENSSELISNELDPELKIERKEYVVTSSQSFEQSKSIGMHKEDETNNTVNEVSRLKERLQVLEADCSFIEHAINALSDGHEEVIQEIASHLRELHKVGMRRYQTCFEDRDIQVER